MDVMIVHYSCSSSPFDVQITNLYNSRHLVVVLSLIPSCYLSEKMSRRAVRLEINFKACSKSEFKIFKFIEHVFLHPPPHSM